MHKSTFKLAAEAIAARAAELRYSEACENSQFEHIPPSCTIYNGDTTDGRIKKTLALTPRMQRLTIWKTFPNLPDKFEAHEEFYALVYKQVTEQIQNDPLTKQLFDEIPAIVEQYGLELAADCSAHATTSSDIAYTSRILIPLQEI